MSVARRLNSKATELNISQLERQVPVPAESLFAQKWKRVVASPWANNESIKAMMSELRAGGYSHTWRFFDHEQEGSLLAKLQKFEDSRRKSELIFYYGEQRDGHRVFIGGSTIGEKVSHAFQAEGFPVVSRCYVMSQFRGLRLYEPLLNHRIELCRQKYGESLRGVHLGTSNDRVFAALRKRYFESNFLYLGNEDLEGNHDLVVRDFLLLSDSFKKELKQALAQAPTCSAGEKLRVLFDSFFENVNDETFCFQLRSTLKDLKNNRGWCASQFQSLTDFLMFMAAVPVSETAVPLSSAYPLPEIFPRGRRAA